MNLLEATNRIYVTLLAAMNPLLPDSSDSPAYARVLAQAGAQALVAAYPQIVTAVKQETPDAR